MKSVYFYICLMLLFISGCGNGGGQSSILGSVFPTPGSVTGLAYDEALITGKRVKLKDAKGISADDVLTDRTTGKYSFDVTGLTAPYLITVTGNNGPYISLARTAGTANINPITTMVVTLAAGNADVNGLFAGITPAQMVTINKNYPDKLFLVTESLNEDLPIGVEVEDYFTGTPTAENGMNDLFYTYKITTDPIAGIKFKTTDAYAITVLDIPVATIAANTNDPLPVLANVRPVAKAGMAQNVVIGATVTLDGSGSADSNRDDLTYLWVLKSKPDNSSAVLSSATDVKPTFIADVYGQYIISLVVNDGKVNSAASLVSVNANNAPVAKAGPAQAVTTGTLVTLDGSASSDEDGDILTLTWAFTLRPVGSQAALSDSTVVNPTFIPDLAGDYKITLTVSDGKERSNDTVIITVTGG